MTTGSFLHCHRTHNICHCSRLRIPCNNQSFSICSSNTCKLRVDLLLVEHCSHAKSRTLQLDKPHKTHMYCILTSTIYGKMCRQIPNPDLASFQICLYPLEKSRSSNDTYPPHKTNHCCSWMWTFTSIKVSTSWRTNKKGSPRAQLESIESTMKDLWQLSRKCTAVLMPLKDNNGKFNLPLHRLIQAMRKKKIDSIRIYLYRNYCLCLDMISLYMMMT